MNQQNSSLGQRPEGMQDETAGMQNGTQAEQAGSQYPNGGDPANVATVGSSAAQSREVQHG